MRTDVHEFGYAHYQNNASYCLDCGTRVKPCVQCLCYITSGNLARHLEKCLGSRYEMQLRGAVGTRKRQDGKFSTQVICSQCLSGRGDNKELFRRDNMMLINTTIGKVPAPFEYRNNVFVDARARHHSSGSYEEYLEQLGEIFEMENEIAIYKTSKDKEDSKRYYVDFSTVATSVIRRRKQCLKKLLQDRSQRVYGVVEVFTASPASMTMITGIASPPSRTAPFLLPGRFTVFFTVGKPDECFIVKPHVDAHGSGPLVFGPSVTGAVTSVAVCAPDYNQEQEAIPPEITNVFSSKEAPTTPTTSRAKPVHVINLSVSGAQINLPAGCWHTVRTYGSAMRISYYFEQRTARAMV